jgi:hypothetical protein
MPNTLPWKMKAIIANDDNVEGLNNEQPLLEGTHQSLSSTSRIALVEYNNLNNEKKSIHAPVMSRSSETYLH